MADIIFNKLRMIDACGQICVDTDSIEDAADAILALSLSPLLVEGKENKELGAARTQPVVSNGHQDAEPSGKGEP